MIDFRQTEIADYEKALELAEQAGDKEKLSKLKKNGTPPYYGKEVTWKSAEYLQSSHMAKNPEIENNHYNTMRDLFSEEYGIIDKINYLRGIAVTFGHVYQQLYEIDLRKDFAPKKKIIWFEHSGHSPWLNESDRFIEMVLDVSH